MTKVDLGLIYVFSPNRKRIDKKPIVEQRPASDLSMPTISIAHGPKSEFSFFHPLRVRWAEVDLQRVVFNGNYLLYFGRRLHRILASHWPADPLAQQAAGPSCSCAKAQIEYHGSAGFDDELQIGVRCARLGRSSMTVAIAIFRGDRHLIDGELVYVYADAHAEIAASSVAWQSDLDRARSAGNDPDRKRRCQDAFGEIFAQRLR